jgi:hypothetical protein
VAVGTIGKSHYTAGRRREKSFAVFLKLWAEIQLKCSPESLREALPL